MIRLITYDCDVCGNACTVTLESSTEPIEPTMCPLGCCPMWVRRSG